MAQASLDLKNAFQDCEKQDVSLKGLQGCIHAPVLKSVLQSRTGPVDGTTILYRTCNMQYTISCYTPLELHHDVSHRRVVFEGIDRKILAIS